MSDINPWEPEVPEKTHEDFRENMLDAFDAWRRNNPTVLSQDMAWRYVQVFRLLVKTNDTQIDNYLSPETTDE